MARLHLFKRKHLKIPRCGFFCWEAFNWVLFELEGSERMQSLLREKWRNLKQQLGCEMKGKLSKWKTALRYSANFCVFQLPILPTSCTKALRTRKRVFGIQSKGAEVNSIWLNLRNCFVTYYFQKHLSSILQIFTWFEAIWLKYWLLIVTDKLKKYFVERHGRRLNNSDRLSLRQAPSLINQN